MTLLTPQQRRTIGPSCQDIDEFRLTWEYSQYWQPPVCPASQGSVSVGQTNVLWAGTNLTNESIQVYQLMN